jgi:tetratricopeptide (TPR) repeat protein
MPVSIAVCLWFLVQAALVAAQAQGSAAQVAAGSHLGGLASGVGLGLLAGLRHAALAERHLVRGRRHLERTQWYAALGEFIDYVRRSPRDAEGHLDLARTYRLTGDRPRADEHYRVACKELAASGRMDRVEEVHREAVRANTEFVLEAPLQLQLAQLFERSLRPEPAEQAYLAYARSYGRTGGAPLALYRAARLAARRQALDEARGLLQSLVAAHPQAPEADLARLELSPGFPKYYDNDVLLRPFGYASPWEVGRHMPRARFASISRARRERDWKHWPGSIRHRIEM